jgi:membrane protein involved in colicin uptake
LSTREGRRLLYLDEEAEALYAAEDARQAAEGAKELADRSRRLAERALEAERQARESAEQAYAAEIARLRALLEPPRDPDDSREAGT